ncbi:MAG TPA: sigma-70 family RNA polymerase sigma factor [Candidatus Acidoferrales bacterium]|nr:sigma-70 family RNA polymerase sigma factor [Candidatus Acidoferrales bacterium]
MIDACSSLDLWLRYRLPEHRERVVEEYWYVCRRAARRFVRPGLERADLEQIAGIGLVKAADRYDAGQTTPFEAYAWLLAMGELMHYVRDNERLMRAPRRVQDLDRRWSVAERELAPLLGREPLETEIAARVNATPADRNEIRAYRASRTIASLELVPAARTRFSCEALDGVLDRICVEGVLASLTPLERKIVRSIHLEETPMSVLAKRLGYSRRHLTRLHRRALDRLRNAAPRAVAADEVAGTPRNVIPTEDR